ncbi:MAG: energy transducer TonB [Spirochaetia bacterium]|nr:energy transducer TonB [Spirochaetia bacterium]
MELLVPAEKKKIINSIQFSDKHPFVISFVISFVIMAFSLFYTASEGTTEMKEKVETFQLMDIDKIVLPKHVTKKEIDINSDDISPEPEVDRAEGLSESDEAIDLSFYPNIVPPRPIGRLKKIYPQEARQREVEAVVFVSIVIGKEGNVLGVNILRTRLSKPLPDDIATSLKNKFANAAVTIMKQARFSPPIIDGKKVSIVMEMPLKFELS